VNRGTIMSLDKKTAVVLTPDGQFVRVRNITGYGIGDEIAFTLPAGTFAWRRSLLAGVSAAALLLLFFSLWMFRTPPVVAYVTMDINPSVELGLDANEKVRKLRAVNEDAASIVDGLDYRGKDLETVMLGLTNKLVETKILSQDDGEVVIASVPVKSVTDDWEIQVIQRIKRILSEAAAKRDPQETGKLEITSVSLPAELRDEAEANGVSSGKMAFWLAAESQGHQLSLETVKNESMKKIAADWGGVDSVMGGSSDSKDDKAAWKRLLDEAKDKKAKKAKQEGKAASGVNTAKPGKDKAGNGGAVTAKDNGKKQANNVNTPKDKVGDRNKNRNKGGAQGKGKEKELNKSWSKGWNTGGKQDWGNGGKQDWGKGWNQDWSKGWNTVSNKSWNQNWIKAWNKDSERNMNVNKREAGNKGKDGNKEQIKKQNQDGNKEQNQNKDRNKGQNQNKDRSKEQNRNKDQKQNKDQNQNKDRSKEQNRNKDWNQNKDRNKQADKSKDGNKERSKNNNLKEG